MPRNWDDLFWVCLAMVAGVVVVFAAKGLFRPPRRREGRWLAILAGAALVAAGCAHRPVAPSMPRGAGWGDATVPLAYDSPRQT